MTLVYKDGGDNSAPMRGLRELHGWRRQFFSVSVTDGVTSCGDNSAQMQGLRESHYVTLVNKDEGVNYSL